MKSIKRRLQPVFHQQANLVASTCLACLPARPQLPLMEITQQSAIKAIAISHKWSVHKVSSCQVLAQARLQRHIHTATRPRLAVRVFSLPERLLIIAMNNLDDKWILLEISGTLRETAASTHTVQPVQIAHFVPMRPGVTIGRDHTPPDSLSLSLSLLPTGSILGVLLSSAWHHNGPFP